MKIIKKCSKCYKEISKKEAFKCTKCHKEFCGKHIYTYVDGNNIAISRNSPEYCEICYIEVYGRR